MNGWAKRIGIGIKQREMGELGRIKIFARASR
jgi:hypothetical protein